jgi:hypothetical protein
VLAAAKVAAATAAGNKTALKAANKSLNAAVAFKIPTCELCTQGRGAMKPLVAGFGRGGPGRWAHILCKLIYTYTHSIELTSLQLSSLCALTSAHCLPVCSVREVAPA